MVASAVNLLLSLARHLCLSESEPTLFGQLDVCCTVSCNAIFMFTQPGQVQVS